MGRGPNFPKGKGKGRINVSKDHSRFATTPRARIIQMTLMLLPYLGVCGYLFFLGLKVLSVIMLLVPFALLWVFYILGK